MKLTPRCRIVLGNVLRAYINEFCCDKTQRIIVAKFVAWEQQGSVIIIHEVIGILSSPPLFEPVLKGACQEHKSLIQLYRVPDLLDCETIHLWCQFVV